MRSIGDLLKAREIIKEYNEISFDDFIKEYSSFVGHEIDEKIIEDYKFTGLNNSFFIDFYMEYIIETSTKFINE